MSRHFVSSQRFLIADYIILLVALFSASRDVVLAFFGIASHSYFYGGEIFTH